MSWQRKRNGRKVTFYWPTTVTDNRGNKVPSTLGDNVEVTFAESHDRSNRAEVPGFQSIEVIKILVPAGTRGAEMWSKAQIGDDWYDVSAPPAYRHGTRQVRHLSVMLRKRPDRGGDMNGTP